MKHRRVLVTERALLARINRKLAKDGQTVRRPRNRPMGALVGKFYLLDLNRNWILNEHVDLKVLAEELGVLHPWEEIAEEE